MTPVTKPFLPPIEDYIEYIRQIWDRCHLTNHGPLVTELEHRLKEYLGVRHLLYLNNGTSALQIAIRALDLKGEIITTPFSYVATTASIVWENTTPCFVDIDRSTLTIDAAGIEAAIGPQTSGILATHVYGIPCDVEKIEAIAKRNNLKVIYDAAHAFGVGHKGKSILQYGDISTLSFHATKLFHTVEGGAVVTGSDELLHKLSYLRNFGHNGQEEFWGLGINAKNSEFHAAMGLSLFPHIAEIIEKRKELSDLYDQLFNKYEVKIERPVISGDTSYNYAYYPVIFKDEAALLQVRDALNKKDIFPRRYFYPSLNHLPYLPYKKMTVSEDISKRVLCLPLYHGLGSEAVHAIVGLIRESLKN